MVNLLCLTGVITDSDREVAKKWPILGDLPLIGQLFRNLLLPVRKMSLSSLLLHEFLMTNLGDPLAMTISLVHRLHVNSCDLIE